MKKLLLTSTYCYAQFLFHQRKSSSFSKKPALVPTFEDPFDGNFLKQNSPEFVSITKNVLSQDGEDYKLIERHMTAARRIAIFESSNNKYIKIILQIQDYLVLMSRSSSTKPDLSDTPPSNSQPYIARYIVDGKYKIPNTGQN